MRRARHEARPQAAGDGARGWALLIWACGAVPALLLVVWAVMWP